MRTLSFANQFRRTYADVCLVFGLCRSPVKGCKANEAKMSSRRMNSSEGYEEDVNGERATAEGDTAAGVSRDKAGRRR